MRIAFLSFELAPVAHVGGLGDVARWLPRMLAIADEVVVFAPHHGVLEPGDGELVPLDVTVEAAELGSVGVSTLGETRPGRPTVHLVESPWFDRHDVYTADPDEHLRAATLTRGAIELMREMEWQPDVVHANDWHTGLAPIHLARVGWGEIPTVFTIHNLAYQGVFPGDDLGRMGLEWSDGPIGDGGFVNSLATGVAASTLVTTVSPTYATEILTPERGEGLDELLRSRQDDLVGILNGIGGEWNPATDPLIPARFDPEDPTPKADSTDELRARLGLVESSAPIAGVVSRLADQKGFWLLDEVLPRLLETGRLQLAVLGTGDPALEEMFAGLAERFPGWAAYHRGFDIGLAHLVEAGAHLFLMPSRYEPCGLNQMYSLRYGTVPVVHHTGGLVDTVTPWDGRTGNGFAFSPFGADGLEAALEEALSVYGDPVTWRRIQAEGMRRDFSWQARAAEYRTAYERAIGPMRPSGP